MKIFVDNKVKSGGPGVFRKRILSSLRGFGCKSTSNVKDDFILELAFIHLKTRHKKPKILRLDGCYYFDHQNGLNRSIEESVSYASHVVFQSKFSEKMCKKMLNAKFPESSVVYNGIDLNYVNSIPKNPSIVPGSFVCSAKWRDNKRPRSIIRGFLDSGLDTHLYVIGNKIAHTNHDRVHYLGGLDEYQSLSVMKSCSYMIHLCHIDSCPNVVIEGLACGLKVLHTNLGGTPEIVKDDGVSLDIDEWNFKVMRLKNIDSIDPRIVSEGIHKLKLLTGKNKSLYDIKDTASAYLDIFRKFQ